MSAYVIQQLAVRTGAQEALMSLPADRTAANNMPEPFRLGHQRWLDGLRGFAILLVLAYHLRLINVGFVGVDLFFVLSGFLITCLLAEEHRSRGAIRLGRFYLRRALRLLPALLLDRVALPDHDLVAAPVRTGSLPP